MPHAFLISGAAGRLGTAMQRVLTERADAGASVRFMAPPKTEFDITSPHDVACHVRVFAEGLAQGERGVLVNAAAFTDVERAEDHPELAYRVNAEAPTVLARAAREAGLVFVHVSTDFVFDGTKVGPYLETDEPNPLSVYGASKLEGERAIAEAAPSAIIVRTGWLFGPGGADFPTKILAAARDHRELNVVDDEIGSPTYSIDLADGIVSLVMRGAQPGIYHLVGSGTVSRYDMALRILQLAGVDVAVSRAHAADFPTRALRPRNSALDTGKAQALGIALPDWRSALAKYIGECAAEPSPGASTCDALPKIDFDQRGRDE